MLSKANLKHLQAHLTSQSQILLRADFNVPIKDNKIVDLKRIKSTVPTINRILQSRPKSLVMLSHLGRPDGQRNLKYSLRPIASALEGLLERKVNFLEDCVGQSIVDRVNSSDGQIFLCENVRFHLEEEGSVKDKQGKKIRAKPEDIKIFRQQLSKLGNVFVNDAFGCAHRAHSSMVGIDHQLKVSGLLLERELDVIGSFLHEPKKPVLVVLGGSKVSDKIQLILNMLSVADQLIIGGGMSGPFLKELYGYKLGSTKIHMPEDPLMIRTIINRAIELGVKIHLPVDAVCAKAMTAQAQALTFDNQSVPQGYMVFDNGPKSIEVFREVVNRASSIFWNGPVGVFQLQNFKKGSESLLRSIVERTKTGGVSIIGGGDTANLVASLQLEDEVSYISTGGGATLEFIQGIKLPGVEALNNAEELNLTMSQII